MMRSPSSTSVPVSPFGRPVEQGGWERPVTRRMTVHLNYATALFRRTEVSPDLAVVMALFSPKMSSDVAGAAFFHHGDSFAMMRGGHLDVTVLGGNEDAMGPQCFYEGFAVIASGRVRSADTVRTVPVNKGNVRLWTLGKRI